MFYGELFIHIFFFVWVKGQNKVKFSTTLENNNNGKVRET